MTPDGSVHLLMTHNRENGPVRVLLLAGLLEFALGVVFLTVPVARTKILEDKTGDANIGVQTTRRERVPPIISLALLASGIALTAANAPRKNRTAL